MEFRTLGPIELWSAGQARPRVGQGAIVLVMLLLTPRTMVPVEALIDRLWDDRPPPKARESLSVYIARLRGSLRQASADDVRLTGRNSGGYVLEVDSEAVDVHQFRRLRRQAAALSASGAHEQAAALLREADALWRGQPLAGISGEWVTRMRDAWRRSAGARSSSGSGASWSSAGTLTSWVSCAICWPGTRWTRCWSHTR